ncbi:ty3-gypsy retrotransposon protein [Tanacetum coccineum]
MLVAKPATLGEVFALARVTEARLMDQQSGIVITTTATSITSQPKPATPRFSGPKTDLGKPPLLPTPTSVSSNIANKPLAIKWISPAERQERLNKGLCFNCDNKWARGHKCPGKFLLLMAEDGEGTGQDMEADATDAVESGDISILNSLIGHGSPRSLQLWGTIGSGEVHVLIDNGSTHNFVQPDIVERMCLPVQTTKAFKVYIGSGESLLCENMCSQVTLSMQGLIMEVDLYVLPMKGPDVVLEAEGVATTLEVADLVHPELGQLLTRFDSLFQLQTTLTAHLEHLECVLNCLQEYQFYVKKSKCVFGAATLEYLGHIISRHGVEMDPKKVSAVREWPIPQSQRHVRGFLGLAGYYRRFIKGYATLAAPLTDLLRKDGFKWGDRESEAFKALKQQLSTTPVLGLPDFEKTFTVETDASGDGIGAVLLQNNKPICYFSRKLGPRMRLAATYQKELFAIVEAVFKNAAVFCWDGCGDHYLNRIMKIIIRRGTHTASFMAFKKSALGALWNSLKEDNRTLEELHRLAIDIRQWMPRLGASKASGGYLQPLPTPTAVWEDVSMDFITGMPLSKGFSVVLVVVDRFSKYAHFATLPTSFNAPKVAEVFVEAVVKHHGIPKTIVSDRDPIFVSKFWTQLFKLSGTQLNHSTAYHPQTDGQTEVVNRGLEQYLRAMVTDRPDHWVRFLPWAEYCYNTSYHSSIKMSPYQALYGKVPLSIIPYPPGSSKCGCVRRVSRGNEFCFVA